MTDVLFIAYLIAKSRGKNHEEALQYVVDNLEEYEAMQEELERNEDESIQ